MGTADLFARASRVLPGGVTAAARANRALGRPLYVERASGPFIWDTDGNQYIDICNSNGATLLGHGHWAIVAAVKEAAERGFACAYDGKAQIELAEQLCAQVPSLEMVRFTTTGTEAVAYALRVARAATGRTKVLKFEGHFHGFSDSLAFSFWPSPEEGGPASAPVARPETAGLPETAPSQIIVAPFNDTAGLAALLDQHERELAAIVMEPINYDAGAILPDPAFLAFVRSETRRRGIVLIFDEILSGYRTGLDCAQGYLGVTPDLCTLGKAVAGGVPLSVFGGASSLMHEVAPLGKAVHTGTYNAHLIQILAAEAFLTVASDPAFYPDLLANCDRLCLGLRQAFSGAGLPVRVQWTGARFAMYFGLDPDTEVIRWRQASALDWTMMIAFCREMHSRGVYVNPAWHHGISAAFTPALVDQVVGLAADSARAVAQVASA